MVVQSFAMHERPEKIRNAKITSIVAAALILIGGVLDYFVYPDYLLHFLCLRLITASFTLSIYFVMRSEKFSERVKLSYSGCIMIPVMIMICYMIYATDGGNSTYYAGLNLILVGLVVSLKWSPSFTLLMSFILIAGYVVSIIFSQNATDIKTLVNNFYFLFSTVIIAIYGAYFYEGSRRSEFDLKNQSYQQSLALEEKNVKLEELDRIKTDFFANVSHELRTPLTIILGNSDLLADMLKEDKYNVLLISLRENGLRLLRLIDNLLELVKFDQNAYELNPEPLNLKSFFSMFDLRVRPILEQKGQSFLKDWDDIDDCVVLIDEEKLEGIINNLFINAVKFTPSGGRIRLSAKLEDEILTLEVEDDGLGMSEEAQSMLFMRYWQESSDSNRKFRGTGIGLNIVKGMLSAMGGKIKCESELERGTKFTVRLPAPKISKGAEVLVKERQETISQYHKDASYTLSGIDYQSELNESPIIKKLDRGVNAKTVLVADDESSLRSFIVECLEEQYNIISAQDGVEAFELGSQYEPDIFIIDYMMPDVDGIELTKRIKASPLLREKPIIMLTARLDLQVKMEALEAGVLDFLPKPFSPLELRLRVNNILSQDQYKLEVEEKRKEVELTLKQLKESEAKLIQQEQLATLGRMSAGLIHEINNPLNYSRTASTLLERKFKNKGVIESGEGLDYLADISEGIDRVSRIVSDLRGFATNSPKELVDVKLLQVVEKAQQMLSDQLTEAEIDFQLNVSSSVTVKANEIQLSQICINLIQNAIYAINDRDSDVKGQIQIMSRNVNKKTYVCIRDNGCGIAMEDLGRIFQPFYTSREVGAGMGLGLSIARMTLNGFNADLDVESVLGDYAEFTMIFN